MSTEKATELKPCPFCGNQQPSAHFANYAWRVVCSCNAEGPCGVTAEGAIASWNARADAAEAHVAELEAVPGGSELDDPDELAAWLENYANDGRRHTTDRGRKFSQIAAAITALRRRVGELERAFAADAERGKSDDYSVCHACDGTGFSPR